MVSRHLSAVPPAPGGCVCGAAWQLFAGRDFCVGKGNNMVESQVGGYPTAAIVHDRIPAALLEAIMLRMRHA